MALPAARQQPPLPGFLRLTYLAGMLAQHLVRVAAVGVSGAFAQVDGAVAALAVGATLP